MHESCHVIYEMRIDDLASKIRRNYGVRCCLDEAATPSAAPTVARVARDPVPDKSTPADNKKHLIYFAGSEP